MYFSCTIGPLQYSWDCLVQRPHLVMSERISKHMLINYESAQVLVVGVVYPSTGSWELIFRFLLLLPFCSHDIKFKLRTTVLSRRVPILSDCCQWQSWPLRHMCLWVLPSQELLSKVPRPDPIRRDPSQPVRSLCHCWKHCRVH